MRLKFEIFIPVGEPTHVEYVKFALGVIVDQRSKADSLSSIVIDHVSRPLKKIVNFVLIGWFQNWKYGVFQKISHVRWILV